MKLKELEALLFAIKEKGFIPSKRKGPTGVGHTLTLELNLPEDNIPIPDIGGRVELKGTRYKSQSPITLFTFNRAVWNVHPRDVIERFGLY